MGNSGLEDLGGYVVSRLGSGTSVDEIIDELVGEHGIEREDAEQFIRAVHARLVEDAKSLQMLRETSRSRVIQFMDEIRNIILNFALFPMVVVQLPLSVFADPVGAARQLVCGLKRAISQRDILYGFRKDALARDIGTDLESWGEFAAVIGHAITGDTPIEFSGGILRRIPIVGPIYAKANDGMFIFITRRQKAIWDNTRRALERAGVPHIEASVAAGGDASQIVPMWNPYLMGLSEARAKLIRTVVISPSLIFRPIELVVTAIEGLVKVGLRHPLTLREKLAVKRLVNIAATIGGIILLIIVIL